VTVTLYGVGVGPGGDVGRLLPVELAKLAIPELELDTLRRIAEREALCREYHAVEPVGKGPVIIALDESGSMDGTKIHTAKALALALAWVARQQRRWAGLIAYSGRSGERLLALPPGRGDEAALCDWLSAFIGQGSGLDLPIEELPGMPPTPKLSGVVPPFFQTACGRGPARGRSTLCGLLRVLRVLRLLAVDGLVARQPLRPRRRTRVPRSFIKKPRWYGPRRQPMMPPVRSAKSA
jgi:hypothetical protein